MPTQSLDHLILFLPADASTNLPSVPNLIDSNFTLTPGGFHADGATSNTLILLKDGCYIELISFVDTDKAPSHWWGPDPEFVGWKDWCLTNSLSPSSNHEKVKQSHSAPVHGGRKRADGVDVKWAVTFPAGDLGGQSVRGRIPFFCHDETERNVRVPLDDAKTSHACGALGVKELSVVFKNKELLEETRRVYAAILDEDGKAEGDEVRFQLGQVKEVEEVGGATIVLRLPRDSWEKTRVERRGFVYGDVVLGARGTENKVLGARERFDAGGVSGEDVGGLWVEYL